MHSLTVLPHKKGSFYRAQYPVRWTAQSTLHFLPSLTVHSDTNSASPGSILAMQELRATTKSLTFPPLSIARFIQLSQQGRQWRERKCPIFETVAKGFSNQGSLDCESGVLPQRYRAPYSVGDFCIQFSILRQRPSQIIECLHSFHCLTL